MRHTNVLRASMLAAVVAVLSACDLAAPTAPRGAERSVASGSGAEAPKPTGGDTPRSVEDWVPADTATHAAGIGWAGGGGRVAPVERAEEV